MAFIDALELMFSQQRQHRLVAGCRFLHSTRAPDDLVGCV
jgi:hypothetical protein